MSGSCIGATNELRSSSAQTFLLQEISLSENLALIQMEVPVVLLRSHAAAHMPALAKFAFGMVLIFGVPNLARRARIPPVVGLLLSGVLIGPHVLGIFGEQRPIVDFLAELGALLLMFISGLEIDLAQFRQARNRSILFGLITTCAPLLLGMMVGLIFGYQLIPALAVGSFLASHTLLGSPILAELGVTHFEPIVITVGATLLADTLSLVVFAICVSTYKNGFSTSAFALQIIEIVIFVPFVLTSHSAIAARISSASYNPNSWLDTEGALQPGQW